MNTQFMVEMPEDLHRAFLARARSQDLNGSQVLRDFLRRYVSEDEAPAPAAKKKAAK